MNEDPMTIAQRSGKFMVAVWRVEDGKVHLDRKTENFPTDDFGSALQLLRVELEKERGSPFTAKSPLKEDR